jgi:hypothetical protein
MNHALFKITIRTSKAHSQKQINVPVLFSLLQAAVAAVALWGDAVQADY